MRRARARRDYYARAHYVRMRRRQAFANLLALSTSPGAPNTLAGGGGSSVPPLPDNVVILTEAWSDTRLGDAITFVRQARLFDVDRSYAQGTINPDIHLTAR